MFNVFSLVENYSTMYYKAKLGCLAVKYTYMALAFIA